MVGPQNQQLIKSIFLQASEIDDLERRRQFLAQACTGDEELLNLLEKMLHSEGSTRAGQLDNLLIADEDAAKVEALLTAGYEGIENNLRILSTSKRNRDFQLNAAAERLARFYAARGDLEKSTAWQVIADRWSGGMSSGEE
ncbi:MAG: hypothetical protein MUD03_15150 [Pirellula sp.]|nr:hypothetical protein [Pirellula sp.]